MLHFNIIMVHLDIKKSHVKIIILHVDIIYLACWGQQYAIISIHTYIQCVKRLLLYIFCTVHNCHTICSNLFLTITNPKFASGFGIAFYHGYCKAQRNAAVIILRYTSYVTMDYEKWFTSILLTQCEEICTFEVQNHAINICRFPVSDVVLNWYISY